MKCLLISRTYVAMSDRRGYCHAKCAMDMPFLDDMPYFDAAEASF